MYSLANIVLLRFTDQLHHPEGQTLEIGWAIEVCLLQVDTVVRDTAVTYKGWIVALYHSLNTLFFSFLSKECRVKYQN